MNTQIQIFVNPLFGEVRTVTMPDGQVGFVGVDVSKALGYKKPTDAILRHVDNEDRISLIIKLEPRNVVLTHGVKTNIINESGLYSLILSSKLPQAKEFKRWVTSEVLPKIRQAGAYLSPEVQALLRNNPEGISALVDRLDAIDNERARLAAENTLLKPKADYCDLVLDAEGCMTTTQIAKGIGWTAVELNQFLINNRIQYMQSGQYMLYAKYARMHLAKNRTGHYYDREGIYTTYSYMVWTQRGRKFIYELLHQFAA